MYASVFVLKIKSKIFSLLIRRFWKKNYFFMGLVLDADLREIPINEIRLISQIKHFPSQAKHTTRTHMEVNSLSSPFLCITKIQSPAGRQMSYLKHSFFRPEKTTLWVINPEENKKARRLDLQAYGITTRGKFLN